jgi:glycosyltransferase involved in cell wall biosynthesis
MIHFDILLITYNRPKLLQHTLESLRMQTYKNFTIHLVDNGSDPPVDLSIIPKDLNIIYIRHNSNRHGCDVGNEAMQNVCGTHFVCLADDDVLCPSALNIVAELFNDNSEIESLSTGFSYFDHDRNEPLANKIFLQKFTGNLDKFDALHMGLTHCNSWGIGQIVDFPKPRMAHSSASFFSAEVIKRTIKKQGELFLKPFHDIGYIGCCFQQKFSFYLDLPLAVIGKAKNRQMRGSEPGNRNMWKREVQFLEHSPLKGCSFVNMGADGHLKALYRNEISRFWDCSLRSDFFIRHLQHIATDDPWTDETNKDIEEALPLAVESIIKYQGLPNNMTEADLKQQIMNYIESYARQLKETKTEDQQTESMTSSEFPTFSNIVDFAVWQDTNYVVSKRKALNHIAERAFSMNTTSLQEKNPYIPITFIIGLYNEEDRIRYVLDHATRWADEIIVVNKSSTDRTKEICIEYGDRVRVVDIPFAPKGHDDFISNCKLAKHDWIFLGPASEIPTRRLISRCREILSDTNGALDLVYVPRKYYSFGIHDKRSPWSISYFPFLINRRKAMITNVIHKNISPSNPQNVAAIDFSDDCCVYHLTHPNAKDYLHSMTDYFEAEAASCQDPDAKIRECFANIAKYEQQLIQGGDDLFMHYLAWPIYWLGTALFVWEKKRGLDVPKFYKELREEVIKKEWFDYDKENKGPDFTVEKLLDQAREKKQSGDMDSAAKYFEDALKISQSERSIALAYGEMLFSYKKYAKAKEIYEGYLKINPGDAEIKTLLKKSTDILDKIAKFNKMAGETT